MEVAVELTIIGEVVATRELAREAVADALAVDAADVAVTAPDRTVVALAEVVVAAVAAARVLDLVAVAVELDVEDAVVAARFPDFTFAREFPMKTAYEESGVVAPAVPTVNVPAAEAIESP